MAQDLIIRVRIFPDKYGRIRKHLEIKGSEETFFLPGVWLVPTENQ